MFCEFCNEHPATVFITQIIEDGVTQLRLCEACARQRAEAHGADSGDSSLTEVVFGLFDEMDDREVNDRETDNRETDNRRDGLSLQNGEHSDEEDESSMNEMFRELQNHHFDEEFLPDDDMTGELDEDDLDDLDDENEFDPLPHELAAELRAAQDGADDAFDSSLAEFIKSNPFEDSSERREIAPRRCPKCSITWDRLRQDGRAGCAHCYETFADQLHEVMQRVQHAPQHHGKKPRAAAKRRNRLEHLRARRDHRLAMLHRRLDEAVRSEKYEEAAKLRDQIKMVSSTIIQEH